MGGRRLRKECVRVIGADCAFSPPLITNSHVRSPQTDNDVCGKVYGLRLLTDLDQESCTSSNVILNYSYLLQLVSSEK